LSSWAADVEIEFGIGVDQRSDTGQMGLADQLIGQHHALDAVVMHHLHLVDGGRRHAPGAVGQLLGKDMRAHGGLAMGGEREAVTGQILSEDRRIVVERTAFEHHLRHGQVFGQQVPALPADLGQRKGRRIGGNALGAAIENGLCQRVEVHSCLQVVSRLGSITPVLFPRKRESPFSWFGGEQRFPLSRE
jgi:hypothetical protein